MQVKKFNGVSVVLMRESNQRWFTVWTLDGYDGKSPICKTQEKAFRIAERFINKHVTKKRKENPCFI